MRGTGVTRAQRKGKRFHMPYNFYLLFSFSMSWKRMRLEKNYEISFPPAPYRRREKETKEIEK